MVVQICSPENQTQIVDTQMYINQNFPVLINSPTGQCLRAALVNAMELVYGRRVAEKLLHLGPVHKDKIEQGVS